MLVDPIHLVGQNAVLVSVYASVVENRQVSLGITKNQKLVFYELCAAELRFDVW